MKSDWILLGAVIAKPDAVAGIDANHIHDQDVRRIIKALQDKNLKDGRAMAVQLLKNERVDLAGDGPLVDRLIAGYKAELERRRFVALKESLADKLPKFGSVEAIQEWLDKQ